jgi:Na+-translocating ferredoxin:NAD+ oxidoreductase RnfE subunit
MTPIAEKNGSSNPVLLIVTGLCPLLIPSITIQRALILGIGVGVHAVILAVLVPILSRVCGDSIRFNLSLAVSGMVAALYGLGIRAVFPAEAFGLSPFLALIALNCFGLSVLRGSLRQSGLDRLPEYARSAAWLLLTWLGFAALRELTGSGLLTLYATETSRAVLDLRSLIIYPIRLATLPAGAFLLLGYGIALYRLRAKRRKEG